MDKYEMRQMWHAKMRQMWHAATSDLKYGVQATFLEVLGAVADGQKQDLVWGADYRDGGACLVNAAGNMLTTGGGQGIPSTYFGDVVHMFDKLNQMFLEQKVNTDHHVSPLAAEILIQWFGTRKEAPTFDTIEAAKAEAFAKNLPYVEPSDEDMAAALQNMLLAPSIDAEVSTETEASVNATPFD